MRRRRTEFVGDGASSVYARLFAKPLGTLNQSSLLPLDMCETILAWCGARSHEDAVAEVSRLATLYESYVVRSDVQLADLAPTARRHMQEVKLIGTPAAKASARATALRIREISAERAKYEKLAAKCSAEAKKLRDLHEFRATVTALGHLNRLLRKTDTDAIMRGAENAVADGEGATATIDGIGQLLSAEPAVDVDEDELMRELEMLAGTPSATSAPEVEVITVERKQLTPVAPKALSSAEYMRQLLAQTVS